MTRLDRDRWLALALLLGLLALAYALVVHPLWVRPMIEVETRIDGLRDRDARARALIAESPAIAQRTAQQQVQGSAPGFLPEATAQLATAGLVQRLEGVVAQASPGGRSCVISNRTPMEGGANTSRFRRVTVQVRLTCGNAELMSVLHTLEAGRPYLFVDNLNINTARYFSAQSATGSGNGLDATFDLSGYLRPAGGGGHG